MSPKIERLAENFTVSEGPHWDAASKSLYFLDPRENDIFRYNPATKKLSKASAAPRQPSFIIPVEGKKDHFLVAFTKDLVIISWDGESEKFSIVQKLATADDSSDKPNNRFNDGKCDSSGRIWAGTMNINLNDVNASPAEGTIYSFDSKQQLKGHVGQIRLSNGFAFSDKTKKMFYIDSLTRSVDRFDFDIVNGAITNRKTWFTLSEHAIPGIPDGMTIDSDGNLWVAIFGGSRVIKVDGNKPESLLDTVKMPALQITSVAWGGDNLDELYVTSACIKYEGDAPPRPENGALYRVTGTGSKGVIASNFKLE